MSVDQKNGNNGGDDKDKRTTLKLSAGTAPRSGGLGGGPRVKQVMSQGRSRSVTVEVRGGQSRSGQSSFERGLTDQEKENRMDALKQAIEADRVRKEQALQKQQEESARKQALESERLKAFREETRSEPVQNLETPPQAPAKSENDARSMLERDPRPVASVPHAPRWDREGNRETRQDDRPTRSPYGDRRNEHAERAPRHFSDRDRSHGSSNGTARQEQDGRVRSEATGHPRGESRSSQQGERRRTYPTSPHRTLERPPETPLREPGPLREIRFENDNARNSRTAVVAPDRVESERGNYGRGPREFRDRDRPEGESGFNRDRGPRPEGTGFNRERGPRPEGAGFYNRDRGPRPEGEGHFNRGPRPEGETGFNRDRGPRPEGAGFYNRDRGPRPEGEGGFNRGPRPEGFYNRGPRPEGEGHFNRGPRPEGGGFYNRDRGPRPEGEGGFNRGPRPEGFYNRGPRPEGEGHFNRGPRPEGEGGFNRGPRPEGGGFYNRGPRPEGEGYFNRGPRPEGGSGQRGHEAAVPGTVVSTRAEGVERRRPAARPDFDKRKNRSKEENERMARAARARKSGGNVQEPWKNGREEHGEENAHRPVIGLKKLRQHRARGHVLPKLKREILLPETIDVRVLADQMSTKVHLVVRAFASLGVQISAEQSVDADTAELLVTELGHTAVRQASSHEKETALLASQAPVAQEVSYKRRGPIVTIMGHVDHGKTSLLDALRKTRVASGEAGGITQNVGAYQVSDASGTAITFFDTPGHEAFQAMRARGAQATDIVVLVVSADDGVQAQTVEALKHVRESRVPLIVAITKMDRPSADPQKIRQELMRHEIFVENAGGSTPDIEISSKTGLNLEAFKELILAQAEQLPLSVPFEGPARGTVFESKRDATQGPTGHVVLTEGLLNVGDVFVVGSVWGRVRTLVNEYGKRVSSVGPGVPVQITGFNDTPVAGERFESVSSEERAKAVVELRTVRQEEQPTQGLSALAFLRQRASKTESGVLKLFIKAESSGALEALQTSLASLTAGGGASKTRIVSKGVGALTETDVLFAKTSGAAIIGFCVSADAKAKAALQRETVSFESYDIIYRAVENVLERLKALLEPVYQELELGVALLRKVFVVSKVGTIAGCVVQKGLIRRNALVRVLRKSVVLGEGTVRSLKREKEEIKEATAGSECGILMEGYSGGFEEGDIIRCFTKEEVKR